MKPKMEKNNTGKSGTKVTKPRVRLFLGSASESSYLAELLQTMLNKDDVINFEITLWRDAFSLSLETLHNLAKELAINDFAVFFFAGTDTTNSRGKRQRAVRDNVIFETGLFMGYLGTENVFIVVSEQDQVKILSDLGAFQRVVYREQAKVDNGIRVVATEIRNQIKQKIDNKFTIINPAVALYIELKRILSSPSHGVTESSLTYLHAQRLLTTEQYTQLLQMI